MSSTFDQKIKAEVKMNLFGSGGVFFAIFLAFPNVIKS